MTIELKVLAVTAASIAFFHTICGPDHYLPFVMISWARKWSRVKTCLITFACGLGHIGSSIVLGLVGVSLGLGVKKIGIFESVRGNVAAWLLIAFGLAYFVWGLRRAYRKQVHRHHHFHLGGKTHTHEHNHNEQHVHIHTAKDEPAVVPWTLFLIFVFGPCEPLIPLLMYPAAQNSFFDLLVVTSVFTAVTIVTMLGVVLFSISGVKFVPFAKVQRFSHAIAGATICLCGLTIQLLGL